MKDVAYQAGQTDPFFPSRSYRDKKNFYLAVRGDHEDINTGEFIENLTSRDNQKVTDLNATGYNVIALGRCYMDSYSTEASVGSLPRAQVSYTAENIMFETKVAAASLTPMIEAKWKSVGRSRLRYT